MSSSSEQWPHWYCSHRPFQHPLQYPLRRPWWLPTWLKRSARRAPSVVVSSAHESSRRAASWGRLVLLRGPSPPSLPHPGLRPHPLYMTTHQHQRDHRHRYHSASHFHRHHAYRSKLYSRPHSRPRPRWPRLRLAAQSGTATRRSPLRRAANSIYPLYEPAASTTTRFRLRLCVEGGVPSASHFSSAQQEARALPAPPHLLVAVPSGHAHGQPTTRAADVPLMKSRRRLQARPEEAQGGRDRFAILVVGGGEEQAPDC